MGSQKKLDMAEQPNDNQQLQGHLPSGGEGGVRCWDQLPWFREADGFLMASGEPRPLNFSCTPESLGDCVKQR